MFWWGKELAKTIWVVGEKALGEDAGTVPQGDSETFTSTEMPVCPSWAQMERVGEGDEIQLL